MMFPHTITIYRHSIVGGADVITKQVVSGFYWYGSTGVSGSGNGAVEADTITIISSPETAANYGQWTVQPKDRIIKGEGLTVESLKDIDGITVLSVSSNICGSRVDNVTIAGR